MVPFEDLENLDHDGKVFNYSGNKPQEPQKPQSHEAMSRDGHVNTNGLIKRESELVNNGASPIASQLNQPPSFKPGQPF